MSSIGIAAMPNTTVIEFGTPEMRSGASASADEICSISRHLALQEEAIMMHDLLEQLKKLESDWNGYGASPIDHAIIATAHEFVDEYKLAFRAIPQVVPMTRGRLQFEWHRGNRSLEIEFENPSSVHYLKWDSDLGIEEEDVVSAADRRTINSLLQWFSLETRDADPRALRAATS